MPVADVAEAKRSAHAEKTGHLADILDFNRRSAPSASRRAPGGEGGEEALARVAARMYIDVRT